MYVLSRCEYITAKCSNSNNYMFGKIDDMRTSWKVWTRVFAKLFTKTFTTLTWEDIIERMLALWRLWLGNVTNISTHKRLGIIFCKLDFVAKQHVHWHHCNGIVWYVNLSHEILPKSIPRDKGRLSSASVAGNLLELHGMRINSQLLHLQIEWKLRLFHWTIRLWI